MAFNPTVGLIDLFGGMDDINTRTIRCVGNPDWRFEEDALRMMRAIRFSAQKGFDIHINTLNAITRNASKIKNVSAERIRDEIVKTITSKNPTRFKLFHSTGLLAHISPELDAMFGFEHDNPHHVFDVAGHALSVMENISNNIVFRLAALFHDVGKVFTKTVDENGIGHFIGHEIESAVIAETVMRRLKFENVIIDAVVKIVRFHMAQVAPTKVSIKRWMNRIGSHDEFFDVIAFRIADVSGQNPVDSDADFAVINRIKELAIEIESDGEAFSKKDLAINGFDLIELGVPQDKTMSEIINALVEMVIEDERINNKETLIAIVKTMI
jgi:tRNA nucleotidyltransferase (CCA-adding enzyme)